ncbi:MAG: hypothetical protein KDC38_19450, partial [Planctomycetes bacterium]|nr:hypothetical protein [Planctomycetota bacterium]
LDILDAERSRVTPVQRVEFDVLYAEVLAAADRLSDALDIIDELAEAGALEAYRDTSIYRSYGILLSKGERAEDAVRVLESLPLHLFDAWAFDALLEALVADQQWEAALARLQGLSTMPEKYRPLWVHCAAKSAQRRLRGADPEAARRLLEAYLDAKDYDVPEVQEVYLQILVETDRLDEATDLILRADPNLLSYLPSKLLSRVRERASTELAEEQRFGLFVRLMEHDDDPELASLVSTMWPHYGSYMLPPAKYVLSYQIRYLTGGRSTNDLGRGTVELEWKDDHFEAKTDDGEEKWWIEGGVWVRQTATSETRIPCRASERPPYGIEQFRAEGQLWSAQIVEIGVPVEIRGRVYPNCLKVHVINEMNQNVYRYEYLAPNVGLVLREDYRFGELNRVAELTSVRVDDDGQ